MLKTLKKLYRDMKFRVKKESNINHLGHSLESSTLVKTEYGQLFKGNALQITQIRSQEGKGGTLYINNKYFGGAAFHTYHAETNETINDYSARGRTPQWLSTKIWNAITMTDEVSIASDGGPLSPSHGFELIIEDMPKVNIMTHDWYISKQTVEKGLCFSDHYSNLNEIKELNNLYKKIRESIRKMDEADLAHHLNAKLDFRFVLNKHIV